MNGVTEYSKANQLQMRDAMDVIEEFSDEIEKMSGSCIDIGCGPGSVTRQLLLPKLSVGATVTGADISNKMIDFAKFAHSCEKRLSFSVLNVEAEELPPNQINNYDNAVSFYCLHWCQNLRIAFGNIYKLLRPGGKCLVLFLGYNSGFESYLTLNEDPRYKTYMKDVAKYIPYFQFSRNPKAELKEILEERGFEVLHCSFREKTFIYKNVDVFKKHVRAVNPFIHRMPKDLGLQFENDLVRDILSKKISFINSVNIIHEEPKILDRYCVLIAFFRKPCS